MAFRFTRAAFKHGISESQIRHVLDTYHPALQQSAQPPDRPAPQLVYLGDDEQGKALEVMTVELLDGDELVIHAMELREKYRSVYRKRTRRTP